MPVILVTPAQVFDFMEITPTSPQTTNMTTIVNAVISDFKKYCRWGITEATYVDWLPQPGAVYGTPLRSTSRMTNGVSGGQDRLQLPQMFVTAVSEVKEDSGLTFGSDTVLTIDTDWRPQRAGGVLSKSGGLLRINSAWCSIPLSIKISYTAGFTESDLTGAHNGIRFQAIKQCILRWFKRQRELAVFADGATGLTRKEKLGDFETQFADPMADASGQFIEGGLTEDCEKYLQESGYVFYGVGV